MNNGIKIYQDQIVTSRKTYRFIDYGLANLDINDCKQLAIYIKAEANLKKVFITKLTKITGGYTGGYSGYVSPNGQVSISKNDSYDEVTIGYQVYKRNAQPSQPKGKSW